MAGRVNQTYNSIDTRANHTGSTKDLELEDNKTAFRTFRTSCTLLLEIAICAIYNANFHIMYVITAVQQTQEYNSYNILLGQL